MNELWMKWDPISGLAPYYDIDEILYKLGDLSILLSRADDNPGAKIRVTFPEEVEAYRNTYETFRISISNSYVGGTFFKVENSEYIRWLLEQSCSVDNSLKLFHIAIATDDKILDIITKQEPIVEFVHD